ncbi:hypothetical protein CDD83_1176 [Cordyceps sp. RAO-2017]|nr:hypothetical protein CDD83_1176 [Cordyceps sp. RAO-2017]
MGSPSSASLALALPEILVAIFDCLDSPALTAAMRASKKWFTCASDVLWRRAGCEALAAVPEQRRQIYASKITLLAFSGDEDAAYHARFQHLRFSSLKHISLDAYRPSDGSYHIRQYFQPPLESFSFYGGDLDHDLLQQLRAKSWRLRRILIDSPGAAVQPDFFATFLAEYTSLEHMVFLHGMDHLITDDLMLHLADRPSLSSLMIGKTCSAELLQRISTQVLQPFRALRNLQLTVPSSAVPTLVRLATQLNRLELTVQDADATVVGRLASLTTLRELSLSFSAATELPKHEILSLKKLTQLEELTVGPDEAEDKAEVTAFQSSFSDTDFDELVSQLRSLRRIRFMIQSNLSVLSLASLAKHCPLLEMCTMPQVFDMSPLSGDDRAKFSFPNLHYLDLGGLERPPSENPSSQELASAMKTAFPKLGEFYVSSDDDYSNDVADAFTASDAS